MSIRSHVLLVGLLTTAVLLPAAPGAAATPAPHLTIHSMPIPTQYSEADTEACLKGLAQSSVLACDAHQVTVTNSGALPAEGPIVLTDALPAGLHVLRVQFFWAKNQLFLEESENPEGILLEESLCKPEAVPVSCEFPETLQPDQRLEMRIYVTVEQGAVSALDTASVSEGGKPVASTSEADVISSTPPPFGPSAFLSGITATDGASDTEAGDHPYEFTNRIDLNSRIAFTPVDAQLQGTSVQEVKDVVVDLPLGFLGSVTATPECTFSQMQSFPTSCPLDTLVGHLTTEPATTASANTPIYNMVPEHGVAAEFGFRDGIYGAHVIVASVAPTLMGYALRATAREVPQITLTNLITTFYGNPAEKNGAEATPSALFTNPSDCSGQPLLTTAHLDSWENPGTFNADGTPNLGDPAWVSMNSESPPVTGCNQLHFHPTLEARPESTQADSPTGLDVTLKVPQTETPGVLATPPLRKAVVTLPEGMSVNPSSANGLAGCSLAQIGISASGLPNPAPPNCPNESKIGTVELESPLLSGALSGSIYVAKQSENPFKSLLAIYIVVEDPATGVIVKLPGRVEADPASGRLTTTVDNSPQFPFSELRTHFFGGNRAALRTPATCGTYAVTSQLTPWSAPDSGPPATPSSSFEITQSADGAPCPTSPGQQLHKPAFSAGTLSPTAGAYSPFLLRLRRKDGSQELSGLNVTLPPGLIGKLAGLSECSDAALAAAAAKSGTAEQQSPSCPPSSEVGTVTVGAGAGLTPFYATGHAYLAGPYKGAPLSLAIITPAVAGPYDLGDVVVRSALQVDPYTAQITAVSDPIPHILQGIPLDIRSIALNMNRSQFTLNPTSCERKEVKGEALSVLGQIAPLSNPFQVGGCAGLAFKPKLAIHLKGSTRRSKHPALTATLTYPKGAYANIARASVALPHSEFLEQSHIKTICTRVQFAEGTVPGEKCPAGSIYGKAKAITPLLDKPLAGPVYLRSSSNKLPDLVAALNGQIQVVLDGTIDSVNGGIRNRFQVVPDAPVSKFSLSMQGGKKGLLVNSTNLCKSTNRAIVKFTGQNGKTYDTNPAVSNSCKGKAKKRAKRHGHRAAR